MNKMSALSDDLEDQEVLNELNYERAFYNWKINNTTETFNIITRQLTAMKENLLIYNNHWFIRFQVLLAQMFIECTKYPERGLSILLNAANRAHKSSLIFNLCECILCLCKLLLKVDPLSSIPDVKELLSDFLPKILEIKRVSMISDAYDILAQVEYMEFQRDRDLMSSQNLNKKISLVLKYSNISLLGYEKVFDFDNLKKIINFQKNVAESCFMNELVIENESKLEKLEMTIQSESKYPII